ncbi:MAG: hypothetical protein RLY97_785 [Pseudomonadota bacterium]
MASILAIAGAVIAPHQAMAQARPYATNGTYEDVLNPQVGTGTIVDEGSGSSYDQLTKPDISPYGLKPDDIRTADPDTDIPTDARSRDRLARQRAEEESVRSRRRKNSLFDHESGYQRTKYIVPYIEASQVVDARISPQHDTVTYSVLAAGVDGAIDRRNFQGSASLRFERRFGWGHAGSSNTVSGVGRSSTGLIQDVLHLELAGYANRTHIDGNGSAGAAGSTDVMTQIWSVFGGPTLKTDAGDLKIDGHYRIGYSKIGNTAGSLVTVTGQPIADIFDSSTVQDAGFRVGNRPGDGLPIGLAVEAGHYREDIRNLAQKARDSHIRGEVTIPIAADTALIGGIGYEHVKITSRDAVRDAAGAPVYNSKGRLVTNFAGPEFIALDTEGLIWDVGVMWRPSPRTSLESHFGERYGQRTGYGMFTYHPTRRSTINVLAYSNVTGFGGQLTNSLFNMPTQFQSVRDALTGNISSCVASATGGNCLAGALATVRSTVYRGKGLTGTYNIDYGRYQTGLGIGYDRRQYIAAAGTVLSPLNGKLDKYYWVAGYVSGAIDQTSVFTATLDAYLFQTGAASFSDLTGFRASGVYQKLLSKHLTASAALGIDGINRDTLPDVWSGSGSVGLRYSF